MSTDYQQLYLNDTFKLAKTMVIKSEASADLVNELLTLKYGYSNLSSSDPTTWKYYMNLAGEYHETDTVMKVTSLDTLTEIEFTKENLQTHTATAAAYEYGSRFYYSLVNAYPEQEQLILGILYPTDKVTAIAAKNATILSYPTELVEEQEITLIYELQQWIYLFQERWDVQAFGVTHSLYPVAQHAQLYLQIIPKLINLRLKRCKTNEAHSFHIRMYLASHCGLDKYYDYMTTKQVLFLYRNINYIQLNAGKTSTFNWLIEKILTDRNIPIAEFQARLQSTFDESYFVDYKIKKIPINTEYNTPNKDDFTLSNLLDKEDTLAIGNAEESFYNRGVIDTTIKNSLSSVVMTKALESSMIDYAGNEIHPLTEVLFNLWGLLASEKKYRVAINFKDPKTSDIRSMYSDDAFVYYLVVMCYGLNIKLDKVPSFMLYHIPKMTLPTKAEVTAHVTKKYISDDSIFNWLYANQPRIREVFSVSSFNTLGTKLFDASEAQWYLVSRTEDKTRRAMVSNMVDQFYHDRIVSFEDTGMSISQWMLEKSIPELDYTAAESQELMQNIFKAATGYAVDPTRLMANIQKAMISIMSELSSYSVQYIQQINNSPFIPLAWDAIRLGDQNVIMSNSELVELPIIRGTDATSITTELSNFEDAALFTVAGETVSNKETKDISINVELSNILEGKHFVVLDSFSVNASYPEYDPSIYASNPYQQPSVGIETYYALSLEERMSIKDIYGSSVIYASGQTGKTDIRSVINNNTINPVSYSPIIDRTL